jgi:hypothetical protein
MNAITENPVRASVNGILLGKIPVSGIRFWKCGPPGRKPLETWILFHKLDARLQDDSK